MIAVPGLLYLLFVFGAADEFRWPLDLPRELTSSFGEFRPGRCHAGIDLRTGGVGIPVYAAGDGYVSRVRCSPYGYGKAVYLTLPTGHTIVHGHLDGYYPELREFVRQAQHKARNYTVDLPLQPGQFRVTKGQLLAFAGQTGIGAPHLHYEWRDAKERPIDPRTVGLTWPDKVRPIIRRVMVSPDGPGSTVNGDIVPAVLEVRSTGTGQYTCDAVRVGGRAGFAVDFVDPASGGAYKLGAYRVAASASGNEIFRVQNDVFSYDHRDDGVVCYHPFFDEGAPFLVLWRWPGNECEFYAHSATDGWWAAPDADTEVRIDIVDFNDNMATLTVPVRGGGVTSPAVPKTAGAGNGKATLDCFGDYLVLTVRFTGPEPEPPTGVIGGNNGAQPLTFLRVNDHSFRAGFRAQATDGYRVRAEHPRLAPVFETSFAAFVRDQGNTVRLGDVTISADDNAAYGTLYVGVDRLENPGEAKHESLKLVGPVYRLWPKNSPIDAAITLVWPQPAGQLAGTCAVYRRSGNSWSRTDASLANGRVSLKTRGLGLFAIMSDETPPAISNVEPKSGATVKGRRPAITAAVRDTGSGIKDIEVTCGGQWLLTAYDPEHNGISWEQDADLPPGAQEIAISVTDYAGNTSRVSRKITLPAQ